LGAFWFMTAAVTAGRVFGDNLYFYNQITDINSHEAGQSLGDRENKEEEICVNYLYSLITLALQSLGQIFGLLLGWVIAVHFGRVPTRQKYILSAMSGVSLLWAVMALSLTSPWVRELFTFARSQAVPFYIKLIPPLAGLGWVLLPLVNSFLAMYLKRQHNQRIEKLGFLLGYKYTPGFALALLLMVISLPLLLLPPVLKGLCREHLTIMIKPEDFRRVLENIIAILRKSGIKVGLYPGTLWRRSPQAILALFAHDLLGNWTKHRAHLIKGDGFQVIVHPTDLVIEGEGGAVVRVRNLLAKELTFLDAYFTWDGAAHRMEEQINAVRRETCRSGWTSPAAELVIIEAELDRLQIPFAEWEVLYRQILQLRLEWTEKELGLHKAGKAVNTMVKTAQAQLEGEEF